MRERESRERADAVSVRAGGAAAICIAEYAAVEPDDSARPRQTVDIRSWLRRDARRAPSRNADGYPGTAREHSQPDQRNGENGTTYQITTNTIANGPIRSSNQGINGYSGFQIFADDAYSHYNALQTTVSRRWGHGYFQAGYTFSKSMDATSSGNTAFNTAFNNESNLSNSYGLSDFDRPHRLAVSYRYDLPFFSAAEGWKRAALGGWAISGITIIQSGTPFSVLDSLAGSAFVGPGYTTTLTGSLAPGGNIAKGYTGGGIQHEVNNGYLNAQ